MSTVKIKFVCIEIVIQESYKVFFPSQKVLTSSYYVNKNKINKVYIFHTTFNKTYNQTIVYHYNVVCREEKLIIN